MNLSRSAADIAAIVNLSMQMVTNVPVVALFLFKRRSRLRSCGSRNDRRLKNCGEIRVEGFSSSIEVFEEFSSFSGMFLRAVEARVLTGINRLLPTVVENFLEAGGLYINLSDMKIAGGCYR